MNQELTQAIKVIQSRQKSFPGLSYPIAAGQFGQDIVVPEAIDCDESRMSIWIPFADGNNRDGVGDVLEIGGIRTDRHQPNPFVLYDHGKQISLPVAMSEDPDTKQYTVVLDTTSRRGKGNAFFYQGTGMSHALRGEEYEHGHFCHQLYDLMVKGYVRGGSIGYTVIAARELPADYQMGTPKGLHLLSTKMLEYSSVVLPANQDTVIAKHKGLEWYMDRMADQAREILCMRSVCGKPLPGHFIKSLSAYAGAVPTKLSKMAIDPSIKPGDYVRAQPTGAEASRMAQNVTTRGPDGGENRPVTGYEAAARNRIEGRVTEVEPNVWNGIGNPDESLVTIDDGHPSTSLAYRRSEADDIHKVPEKGLGDNVQVGDRVRSQVTGPQAAAAARGRYVTEAEGDDPGIYDDPRVREMTGAEAAQRSRREGVVSRIRPDRYGADQQGITEVTIDEGGGNVHLRDSDVSDIHKIPEKGMRRKVTDKRVLDTRTHPANMSQQDPANLSDEGHVQAWTEAEELELTGTDDIQTRSRAANIRDTRAWGEEPGPNPYEDSHAARVREQAESGFVPHTQRTGAEKAQRMKGLRKKYRVKSQTDDVRETGTRQAQVGERVHVDDRYARRTDGPRNPLNRGEATARFEDTLGGGRVDYRTDVEGREEAAANEAILKDESGSPLGPQVTRDPSSIRRDHPKSLNRGVKMAISPNVQVGSRVRSRPTRQNAEAMVEGTSQHPLDYMNRHTNHGVASQVGTVDGDVPFVRISRENDSDLHAYDDYDDVDVLPGKALQGGVQPGKALQGGVQPGSRVQVRPNYATAEDMAEEDVHLPVGGQARYLTTAEVTQMNTREGEYDGDAMNGSHVVRSDVLDGTGQRRRENYPADQYDLRPPPKKGMARKAGDPNSSGQGNNINPEWVNELHQSPGGGYELHSTRVAEGPNDLGLTFIEGPYDTYDRAVQEHEHENESGPDHGYTPRVHLIDRTQKGVYLNTQAVGQLKALVGALAQLAGYKTADGPITDKRVVDAQLNWDTAPVTVREVSDDLGLSHPDRALSIDHAYNLRDARNFGEDPPQSPVEDSHAQRSRVQAESGFVPHSQRTGSKATRKEIVDSMADKNTGAGQVLAEVNRFDLPVQDEFESISRGSQVSSARKEGREPPESPYEDDAARAARIQGTPKKDLRSKYRKKSMGTKVTDKRGVDTRTHKPNVSTYSPGFLTDTGYKQVVEEENDLDSQQRDANGRMFNGNEIYIDAASDRVNRGGAFRNSEDVPRTDDDEKDWLGKAVDRRAGMNRNRQATGVSVDATDAQRRQTQAQVGTHLSTDQQARQSTPGQYPEEPNPGTQDPAALERAAQIEQRRQQWQERDRAARGEKSKRVKMALDPNVKPGDRVRVRPTLQQAQNRLQAGQTAPKGKESTAEILRDEDTRYGVVGQIRNFGYPDVHQVVQFRNEAGGKEEKRPAFSDLEDIDPAPKKGLEKAQAVRVDRLSQQDAENARRGGVAGNEIGRSMVTTEDEHGQRTQRLIGDANARIDAQAFDNQLSGHGVHTGIRPQGPQHDVQPGQQSIPRVIGPGKIALKPQARQELQQAGVDLSKSQKSVSRKRYSLKNSQPGTSLVWVARKDLGPAMSEAVTLGLKAIVRDDGQKTVRLKVSGEDATIDKLAKKYGRPINLQGR